MFKKICLVVLIILCIGIFVSTVSAGEVNETVESLSDMGDMPVNSVGELNVFNDSLKLTKNSTMDDIHSSDSGNIENTALNEDIIISPAGNNYLLTTADSSILGESIGNFNVVFTFKNIKSDSIGYTYDFITYANSTNGDLGDFNVKYTLTMSDGTSTVLNKQTNNLISQTLTKPLYNLDVLVENRQIQVIYPLKALQMIVDNANMGDTVTLPQDYARVDDVDKYLAIVDSSSYNSNSHIIINTPNIVIDGNGHTLDAVNNGRVFEINSNYVTLYNMILKNTYVVGNNVHGGSVWWKGSNGKIDQLNIIDSQTREESMSSWCYVSARYAAGGSVYWQGANGIINHTTFTNSHAAHSGGSVYWTGNNGVIDNCQFKNSKIQWAKGESVCSGIIEGSAIHWIGENGKLLNSKIQDCSVSAQGAYQGSVSKIVSAVYSTKSSFYVDNITITNTQSPGGNGYSLNMTNPSGSNFGDNINIENKILTPTFSIISTNNENEFIIIVKDAKSGTVTYTVDGSNGGTGTVNRNGQAIINAPVLSTGKHNVNIQYSSDLTYVNDASGTVSDFSRLYKELSFSSISLDNNIYNYSFVLKISDGLGYYDANTDVTYNIALADGSIQTVTGLTNHTVSWSGDKPLYNLTAIVDGEQTAPIIYPLKALQLIINAAGSGSTIYLPHDYTWTSDIDTCNDGGYFFNYNNKIVDGQGYTINGLSNKDTGANGHAWSLVNLGNNAVLRNINLVNFTYNRYGYVNGGAVYVSGSSVKLINVSIIRAKNTAFAYTSLNGYGGAIIWNGNNGLIDNCRIINSHGGQWGTVTILKDNVVMSNTKIINSSVDNWHSERIGAIAIRWDGAGGTLINTEVTGSEILRSVSLHPDYQAVVAFTKKPKLIENVSITPSDIGYSVTCYSLQVPFAPVEDYIGQNILLDGGFKRITLTSITFSNDVFTVNGAKSGTVSYIINGGETQTVQVDKNGQFRLDYNFNPSQNYIIKIIYNENTYYNSYIKYFDYSGGAGSAFGSFTDLNNLIQSSSSSVINLNQNYIYDPLRDSALAGGITISKSITINGNGYYIDADFNPVRIFTTTKNVVLNNITFKNSRLNSAGNAVYAKAPITIENCTFDNNWASNCFGAAINLAGGNSYVRYSTFTNNKAKTGAGIVVNSNDNYIQYCLFEGNSKDYGGNMNYGSDISISGGYSAYVNYNAFLDPYPLRQISADYSKSNWYGSNALPDSSASGAPGISNYLKASLDYTLNSGVLTVGITFSESDTGNIVNVPWLRSVIYALSSKTIIGDNLNKVFFSGVSSEFVINAVIDNQRLTNSNGNSWYVDSTGSSWGSGTESSPYKSLRNALNRAGNGDTIYIAPGTYTGSGNMGLTISKSVTLERWGNTGEVVFDGQNTNTIFTLNSNIVISSLTFKNAKNGNGGALVIKGNALIINSIFKDNTATNWGGAIDMNPGDATIINSRFINNNAPSGGGAISTAAVNLNIINSIFINNYGGMGGAINSGNTDATLYVSDSTFKDNRADTYGGALVFDGQGNITNSTFISNVAGLGGGAVYMWDFNHTIKDSRFISNSAADGGAIITLLSNLNLNNNYFNDNNASSFGGAIYKCFGELLIIDGEFLKNNAYYDGGALYSCKGLTTVYEVLFRNNTAGYGGGAIHSLASDLFCVRLNMVNIVSAESNGYVNTIYLNSFIDFGDYTMVVADTSNYNGVLPAYFSLVDNGWDTSVKNQGSLGICWDYAVIAIVETAIKKATGVEVDLSEDNVKNLISKYSIYGNGRDPNAGGIVWDALSYLANSLGPVYESCDPTGSFGFSPLLNNIYHISNIAFASRSRSAPLDNNQVKEALMKYGAVRVSINMDDQNKGGYNYYHSTNTGTNHAIALVGWDDNYSKDNFPDGCPGDGAWIVKNSWGPSTGNGQGYIYVSYYDQTFAWDGLAYIIFNDTIRYSRVYQYDYSNYGMKSTGASVSWYKNTYTSVKNEALTAFSTYFNEITEWEVNIYVGGELKHTQTGSSIAPGYFTFNFNKIVPVAKDEEFTIELKVNKANIPYVGKNLNTLSCGAGVSYYSKDGTNWIDLNNDNQVACLKVFTQNMPGSIISIDPIVNVTYNNPVTVSFNVENRTDVSYVIKTKNGDVIANVDNFNGNKIILAGLAGGDYVITIINSKTDDYIGCLESANFTVSKADSTITVNNIASVNYGNSFDVSFNAVNRTSLSYIVKTVDGSVVVGNTTIVDADKITIPILNAGQYIITVANSENENYTGSSASANFTILKVTPTITVTADNVVYPNSIYVSVKSNIAGTYVVKVGDSAQNVKLTKNKVKNVVFSGLGAGSYDVGVTYAETTNYNAVSKNTTVNILKASSKVTINTISDQNYGTGFDIELSIVNRTGATYIVKTKSGKIVVANTSLGNANKVSIPVLDAGEYVIAVANSENENYTGDVASAGFKVLKATPTVIVSVGNVTYPSDVVVNVKSSVAGVYTVKVGGKSQNVDLSANVAKNVAFSDLGAGSYEVSANYAETVNYNAVSKNTTVKVFKASSKVTINTIADHDYGSGFDISFSVVNSTTVTYVVKTKAGSIAVGNTSAGNSNKVTIPVLNAGEYVITVANSENENYTGDVASAGFKVLKVTPTVTVTAGDVTYPSNVVVNVKSSVAGVYTVKVGGKSQNVDLSANVAKNVAFSDLGAGSYEVSANYAETVNYNAVSKNTTVKVLKASSKVTIDAIADHDYGSGFDVSFSVINSTAVTYVVKTKAGSIAVGNTTANDLNKVSIPVLSAGEYVITIANAEDNNYTGDVASASFKVLKVTPAVTVSAGNVVYHGSVVVNVKSDVDGTYVVKVGSRSQDVNLKANVSWNVVFTGLGADTYDVIVSYGETANYNAVSRNTTVKVFKASSKVTINPINDAVYPNIVNVTYAVVNKTSLAVTVTDKSSGKSITIPDASITDADIVIAGLDAGDYSITIKNTGDDNYNSSSASNDFKINRYAPNISFNTSDIIYSDNLVVSISSDVSGVFTVKVADKSQTLNLTANIMCSAVFTGLNAGEYKVNVSSGESKNYNAVFTGNIDVKVIKASSTVSIVETINGVFKTEAPVINVEFENRTSVNYTIIKGNVIVSSGDYNNIDDALSALGVGDYSLTIINKGDENHNASSGSIQFSVLKAGSKITVPTIYPIVYGTVADITFSVENRTAVTYTVKDKSGNVVVKNNTLEDNVITIANLSCGIYTLEIANSENENYTGDAKSVNFTIANAVNIIEVTAENRVLPGNVTVKVKATVDGIYRVEIGSYWVDVCVKSGEGASSIALPAGLNYTATTSFKDCENYTVTVKNAVFNVTKAVNNIKIEVDDSVYPENTVLRLTATVSGTYTVDVSGFKFNLTVSENNGAASKSILLTPNNYFADITDYASDDYEANVTPSSFKVNKGLNNVKVIVSDVKYGQSADVYVTADVKGNYTVNINGTEIIVEVPANGATGVKTTANLTKVGRYCANVTSRLAYYTDSITDAKFNVIKAINNIKVEADSVTYPENVLIRVTADVAGIYTVVLSNGNHLNINVDGSGTAGVRLAAGNYTARVIYSDENYEGNITNASFEVSKGSANLKININKDSFVFNQENITGYITSDVAGNYELNMGDAYSKVITITHANEIVEFNAGKLNSGDYNAVVNFRESENYTSMSAESSFKVTPSGTVLIIRANGQDNIYTASYGAEISITSYLPDGATGYVEYSYENGDFINRTVAGGFFTLKGLNAGTYKISAEYSGDANYNSTESSITLIINKAVNNVKVEVDTADYPNNITLRLTADIAGIYEVSLNSVKFNMTVGKNAETVTKSLKLTPGTYATGIGYADANYEANVDSTSFEVANGTIHDLKVVVDSVIYPNVAHAVVYASVDGKYSVIINNKTYDVTVKNGSGASGEFEVLDANQYEAEVVNGIEYYNVQSNKTLFSVFKANSTLNVNDIEFIYGSNGSTPISSQGALNVTVSQIIGATIKIENGILTVAGLNAGEYKLNVTANADSNHESVSKIINVTVIKANPDLSVSVTDAVYPNNVTITVKSKVDRQYDVDINGTVHKINVVNGIGHLSVKKSAGNYNATVNLSETTNYNASSAYYEFNVFKNSTYEFTVTPDAIITYNQSVTIYARISGDATGKVTFYYNNTVLNKTEINSDFEARLHAGQYLINASYEGDNNYESGWKIINLTVNKLSDNNSLNITFDKTVYGEGIVVNASANKYSDITGIVYYYIGGECIGNSSLNSVGTISKALSAGKYDVTAVYLSADFEFANVTCELIISPAGSDVNSEDAVVNYLNQPYNLTFTSQNVTAITYGIYGQNNNLIENGTVNADENITLPNLNVGRYTIVLSTLTDTNHTSISKEYDVTVTNATMKINITAQNTTYGNNPVIIVNVEIPGRYNIQIDNVYNKTKELTVGANIIDDVPLLDADEYLITVTGLVPNFDRIGESQLFKITKAGVSDFNITISDVKEDENAEIIIITNASGMVEITVNNNTHYINISQKDRFTLPKLPAGKYIIKAVFMQDKNHLQSDVLENTLTVSPYTAKDLQKDIDDAVRENNGELNLTHDYIFLEWESAVIINSTVKINGNSHIINANRTSSIFEVNADNVALANMTLLNSNNSAVILAGDNSILNGINFINNTADDGGAVRIKGSNVEITDCEFTNNTAVQKGGAIIIADNNAKIRGTSFHNNNARLGPAIYIENAQMDIADSGFNNNELIDHISSISVGDNASVSVDELTHKNSDVVFDIKDPKLTLQAVNAIESGVEIIVSLVADDGSVSAVLDSNNFTSNVKNRTAVIRIAGIKEGEYINVPVTYNGSEYYAKSQLTINFTVVGESQGQLKITDNKNIVAYYLEGKIFKVKVVDSNQKAVMGADVTFTINRMVFNVKTDKNGIASLTLNLNPGTYTVKTSVSGHEVSNNIQIRHILSAKMTVKVKKSKGKTIIKIFAKGHKIKQTVKVKFKFTGKNKIKVKFGSVMKNQKVTVKFKGKKYTVKVNKKGYGKLKLSKKVVKKLKKGKKYKLKATYKAPKLYKKIKLTIKFKGKKYKVKTNKNGVAKFKITKKMVKKIRKGKTVKYTVTYKNDSIKRFIKIK